MKILAILGILFATQTAFAAKVTCQPNKAGNLEATRAWKNTLGPEADRVCAEEQARLAPKPATPAPTPAAALVAAPTQPQQVAPPPNPRFNGQMPSTWSALKSDRTMGGVLARWSVSAGWSFGTEDWVVPKDLPIMTDSVDAFKGDFKEAVRDLTSTSELTDMSVQPCFYSNNVLRVIKSTDSCLRIGSEKTTN